MPHPYAMQRRYSLPFESSLEGEANVGYGAVLDRCAILAPGGQVTIGHSQLVQCVIIEPCSIGDNVRATAAILQGRIDDGCLIEAHADIQGTLMEGAIVRTGAVVQHGAIVGPGAELLDGSVVRAEAEIGADATIGVHADVGEHAFVQDGARVPHRAVIPAEGYWAPPDARMRGEISGGATFHIVGEEDEGEDDDEERPDLSDWDWERHGGDTGDMVRGHPHKILQDFRPGTARSWVLVKLARIAAFLSPDNRISKRLIREHRPDLLEHPVTKEVLRMQPAPTGEQLNEMSWASLGEPAYDAYFGGKFHAGRAGQMLGPKANDVFVLSVPKRVWLELTSEMDDSERADAEAILFRADAAWHPDRGIVRSIGWVRTVLYPHWAVIVVEIQSDRSWMGFRWRPDDLVTEAEERLDGVYRPYGDDPHPERTRRLYQSARTRAQRVADVANRLRVMYHNTFAQDALNVVVEWAFTERYGEVWVLDYQSRKAIGGTPPRDFYDKFPKQYTVSAPQPLPEFVETYEVTDADGFVLDELQGRRIVPNRAVR